MTIPIDFQGSYKITDRKNLYYYDFRITDEAFLALLEVVEEWKETHPGPHHKALRSLFDVLQGMKFPQAALESRQARSLLLESQSEVVYICPHCKHHKLDNVLRITGECAACQVSVVLDDAFLVTPDLTTETVLSYMQRGPYESHTPIT